MSARKKPLTKKALTAAEASAMKRKRGNVRSAKRRANSMRRRSLEEVRAAVRDAEVMVCAFARHEKRTDATVLASLLAWVGQLPPQPMTEDALVRAVASLADRVRGSWDWARVREEPRSPVNSLGGQA